MPVKNEQHKHGFIRMEQNISASLFPFSLPYIATTAPEAVTIDNVFLPLDTIAVNIDDTFANCRPLIRIAGYTLKALQAQKFYFQHAHATYDAVPVSTAIKVLTDYAKYQQGSRGNFYAKRLASKLRSKAFIDSIKSNLIARATGTANMALGCISENITLRGSSFKPIAVAGWDKPFKVSEKYKNNPIKPKPHIESCAPLPPVITRPKGSSAKSKKATKYKINPFDTMYFGTYSEKSAEAKERGERNAKRMRKILNRTKVA